MNRSTTKTTNVVYNDKEQDALISYASSKKIISCGSIQTTIGFMFSEWLMFVILKSWLDLHGL